MTVLNSAVSLAMLTRRESRIYWSALISARMLSFSLPAGDYKRIAKFRCSILREFCARYYVNQATMSWITRERLLLHVDAARASASVFNGTLTAAVLLNYWYLLGTTGVCTNMFSQPSTFLIGRDIRVRTND